jgi:OOP family OmpA-OmpF porin
MKLNDNISIEIGAHTDARGNDEYNMKLSAARAKSCVDYIISKGIAAKRIVSNGYGETRPIINEPDINAMEAKSPEWEAAHQKNRRTAFKVTGESSLNLINKTK